MYIVTKRSTEERNSRLSHDKKTFPFSLSRSTDTRREKKERTGKIISKLLLFFSLSLSSEELMSLSCGGWDAGCYDKTYTATITKYTYKRNRCCLCKHIDRHRQSLQQRKLKMRLSTKANPDDNQWSVVIQVVDNWK